MKKYTVFFLLVFTLIGCSNQGLDKFEYEIKQAKEQADKGNYDLAIYHYEKALELNSKDKSIKKEIQALREKLSSNSKEMETNQKEKKIPEIHYQFVYGGGTGDYGEIVITFNKDGEEKEVVFSGTGTNFEDINKDGTMEILDMVPITTELDLPNFLRPYWVNIYHFDVEKEQLLLVTGDEYNNYYLQTYIPKQEQNLANAGDSNQQLVSMSLKQIAQEVVDGKLEVDPQALSINQRFQSLTAGSVQQPEVASSNSVSGSSPSLIGIEGLSFVLTDIMGPQNSNFGWIRVHFNVTNGSDKVITLYADKFVLRKTGIETIGQTMFSAGFMSSLNIYELSSIRILPGDTARGSFDFAGNGVSTSEGLTLTYIKGDEVIPLGNLPAGRAWQDN